MANIQPEINAFRNAIYGEEVRESMISLAEKVNADNEAETERATAAEEELKDSLSEAITNVKQDLSDLEKNIFEYNSNILIWDDFESGYCQGTVGITLAFFSGADFDRILVRVKPNTKYYINKVVHFYGTLTSDKKVIAQYGTGGAEATDVFVTTESNASYIYFNIRHTWFTQNPRSMMMSESTTKPSFEYAYQFLKSALTENKIGLVNLNLNDKITYANNKVNFPPCYILCGKQSTVSFSAISLDVSVSGISLILYDMIAKTLRNIAYNKANAIGLNGVNNVHDIKKTEVVIGIINQNKVKIFGVSDEQIIDKTKGTIAFLGDSITAGIGSTNLYHMILAEKLNVHAKNYGVGGAGITSNFVGDSGFFGDGVEGCGSPKVATGNNNVLSVLNTIPNTIGKFCIFAGTNDWGNTVNPETFRTDLLALITELYQRSSNYVFITPIKRLPYNQKNAWDVTVEDYVNIIIEECENHGVPCLDLYHNSGMNPNDLSNKSYFYNTDGLHPNNLGQEKMSKSIIEFIDKFLM